MFLSVRIRQILLFNVVVGVGTTGTITKPITYINHQFIVWVFADFPVSFSVSSLLSHDLHVGLVFMSDSTFLLRLTPFFDHFLPGGLKNIFNNLSV